MLTLYDRTRRVLHALGNVRGKKVMQLEADDNPEEALTFWNHSFAAHQDCVTQYESTVGKFNRRTADALHKLAEHHIRRKEHALAQ